MVIVVHGSDVCRRNTSVLLPAGMLVNAGTSILLIDLRNHVDSEVDSGRLTLGALEYRDVLGAFDYLCSIGYGKEHIGVMGVFLGAAVVLDALYNLYHNSGGHAGLWVVEGTRHMEVMFRYTDQYREKLVDFFRVSL